MILAILFGVMQGCVTPEAVKTDIQGVRTDMERLEKVVDQKADNTVVAEQIDEINNMIEQTVQIAEKLSLWQKDVQADTINYGGAGWVIIGSSIMAVIFIVAGFLFVKAFLKRDNLLTLLTCVVKKVGQRSPEVVSAIKKQLKIETSDGGLYTEQDRKNLGHFAKNKGTFAEQRTD